MYKKISIALFISFALLVCQNRLGAQIPNSPGDISDIRDLVKKEDFGNLSKFLQANNFTILKWNLNYSHGSYYVIAEIECEKKLTTLLSNKNSLLNVKNTDHLIIEYYEYDDSKKLTISDNYISFGNNFSLFYYIWRYKDWTYVKIGNSINGFQIGKLGRMGTSDNTLKKVPTDSIKLEFVKTVGLSLKPQIPIQKSMQFVNNNENFGVLRNYTCELYTSWPKSEYYLPSGGDTAFSLNLRLEENYPKFINKLSKQSTNKIKTIQLIKSGKIYYINVSIAAKKKKYVLDSGASDFTIDESTYKQLIENGIIMIKHKLADAEYQMADGNIKTYKRTIIPEINISGINIENIVATIVPDGQPLLLGKSVLDNFKAWKIENSKNQLIVEFD